MEEQIQQLRQKDRAKELTDPHSLAFLTAAASDSLLLLLEAADSLNSSPLVKFYSRTLFIGLALSGDDASGSEDIMSSSRISSFYHAYQICSSPQEFGAFLLSETVSGLLPYFLSSQHQQIQQQISSLTGPNYSISSPYDFVVAVREQVGHPNFERTVGYIIDFALTIQHTCRLSSEEIFVGSCLVIWEHNDLGGLDNLLLTYFESSLAKGHQLKAIIQEGLLLSLSGQV